MELETNYIQSSDSLISEKDDEITISKQEEVLRKDHSNIHFLLNPRSHLLRYPTHHHHQKKIILMGPPASGKSTLSPLIAERLGVIHVRKNNLFQREISEKTPEGLEIVQWRMAHPRENNPKTVHVKKHKIPMTYFIQCFKKRYNNCGWVYEGGPKAEAHFHLIKNEGIFPDKVIYLEVSLELQLKRIRDRRVDPLTDRTYNLELNPPKDPEILNRLIARNDDEVEYFKSRLEKYERDCKKVVFMYPSEILKVVKADKPIEHLLEEILEFINS